VTAAAESAPDLGQVRLAELVAALSLGIDLGFGQPMEHVLRQCLIALRIAERFGLDDQERADVCYTALLVTVGCHTDAHEQAKWFGVAHHVRGQEAARALARRRAGRQFDPRLAGLLDRDASEILGSVDAVQTWDAVIAAEPALAVVLRGEAFDRALQAVADFVDLKSPYMLGHARGVAALAHDAAVALGLPAPERTALRRAGMVAGFGRLGVSNSIWDKRGSLGAGEWERVRLSPYLTERILRQSPALAPLGAIAVAQRERLDGSGYPRGLSGPAVTREARVLGAADAYQSMTEPRPYRPAMSADEATATLRAEARAGRLDGDAVEAVLGAAGHRVRRHVQRPAACPITPLQVRAGPYTQRSLVIFQAGYPAAASRRRRRNSAR
jgi:HD-GYP domain-containing protein (c-di-GMP phosphodiesterase class II)